MRAFETRDEASRYVASRLAELLAARLSRGEDVSLVVSGGSSPVKCLRRLSRADINWSRVQVTLSDERCVPVTDTASNEGMVRRELLRERAASASFVEVSAETLAAMPKPYAGSLVGVGEDGHFASIFPDLPEKDELLDLDSGISCRRVETAASDVARMTMSLAELVRSQQILLLAFGEKKRNVLASAQAFPVGALLAQGRAPVEIVWAP